MLNATSSNRFTHDLLAPADGLSPLGFERRLAFARLALREDERVLLISRSPAADLQHVPDGVRGLVAGFGTPPMDLREPDRPGFASCRLDPESFDLPDETFDAVALLGALENVEDPAHTLAEAGRVVGLPQSNTAVAAHLFDRKVLERHFRPLLALVHGLFAEEELPLLRETLEITKHRIARLHLM